MIERTHRRPHREIITIDNPPANTWTPEGLRDCTKLVGELNRRPRPSTPR